MFLRTSFLLFLLSALIENASCAEVKVSSVEEFIQFKDNVNSGTNYEGTTVFLDSDLFLDGKAFEPIGTNTRYFRGTFDDKDM